MKLILKELTRKGSSFRYWHELFPSITYEKLTGSIIVDPQIKEVLKKVFETKLTNGERQPGFLVLSESLVDTLVMSYKERNCVPSIHT